MGLCQLLLFSGCTRTCCKSLDELLNPSERDSFLCGETGDVMMHMSRWDPALGCRKAWCPTPLL